MTHHQTSVDITRLTSRRMEYYVYGISYVNSIFDE